MVNEALEREYARRGIGLIQPERGVEALLAELTAPVDDPQVIYLSGSVEAFDAAG
jgi:hypothetical protein